MCSIPFEQSRQHVTTEWSILLVDSEKQRRVWKAKLPKRPNTTKPAVAWFFSAFKAFGVANRPTVDYVKSTGLTARDYLCAEFEKLAVTKLQNKLHPTLFAKVTMP